MANPVSTRDEALRLAAVLRSRGRRNSLHDIKRAADLLENVLFADAPSASVGTHLNETVKGRNDHPVDLAANPTSDEGKAREAARDYLDKAGVPAHALVSPRAGFFAIKPIEWEHSQGNIPGQEIWHTGEPWTYWIVRNASDGKYVWCENLGFSDMVPASPVRGVFDTLEEAKTAAQTEFEDRIRACVVLLCSAVTEAEANELQQIEDMLSDGQGDDDGPQILPEFEADWSTAAKVAACLNLLEQRRDALLPTASSKPEAHFTDKGESSEHKWWDVETERLPHDIDEAYLIVKTAVLSSRNATASFIQRRFGIGYNRASNFIDRMEREGLISPWSVEEKGRKILVPVETSAT